MRSLSFDRNLVQFYGACLEREYAMLVLEYMEGGDLYQAIQEIPSPGNHRDLSWYKKGGGIALDVAKGLVFLHQHGVRFYVSLPPHSGEKAVIAFTSWLRCSRSKASSI